MKFSAEREAILAPLQAVIGVVERRQTMPILANVLLVGRGDQLAITATDLEVELVAKPRSRCSRQVKSRSRARKLLDIIRALPEKAQVTICGRGRTGDGAIRQEPFHADDAAGDRLPDGRGHPRAANAVASRKPR